MGLVTRVNNLATAIGSDIKAIFSQIGSLSSLATTEKTSLVAAVNEVAGYPGLTEQVHDIVANLLVQGGDVTISYDDALGKITISASSAGGGISLAQVRKVTSLGV